MQQYKNIIKKIISNGKLTENRTGVNTLSVFGDQYQYDMADGFPILTTREQPFDKIVAELLWYLKGTDELGSCDYLDQHKVKIWDKWRSKTTGGVGPLYPYQFRNRYVVDRNNYLSNVDQYQKAIDDIKNNPHSRRIIIDNWDIGKLPNESISPKQNVNERRMALAPCLTMIQFKVERLSLKEMLRSRYNRPQVMTLINDLIERKKCSFFTKSDDFDIDCSATMLHHYLRNKIGHEELQEIIEQYQLKRDALSMMLYQRSWDVGAAGGWNVSQMALLLHITAGLTSKIPHIFTHTIGDMHIYKDQLAPLSTQINRTPYKLPTLSIHTDLSKLTVDDLTVDMFDLENYQYHPAISIPVAE